MDCVGSYSVMSSMSVLYLLGGRVRAAGYVLWAGHKLRTAVFRGRVVVASKGYSDLFLGVCGPSLAWSTYSGGMSVSA